MIIQKEITLPFYERGYHLITNIIENNLSDLPQNGILNIFIKHTSAAITINENADPSVRADKESFKSKLIPDGHNLYTHTSEGADDMSGHIKSLFIGHSINIPITNYELNMGVWQGIYLCEFRNSGANRKLILSIY
ncbi:MAG: secondary thiamine-phosphate synthase enzyme YjbQ [Bacteroidales bacterium]|jgi:secondary thiamine-phosphate synthase enzyme|nr:secondary thiamine-phosphate synthase enzyme YjbQ [Bacteroidales bacterium]